MGQNHGYKILRIDELVPIDKFQKLNRYQEHDIELVIEDLGLQGCEITEKIQKRHYRMLPNSPFDSLRQGKGTALLLHPKMVF